MKKIYNPIEVKAVILLSEDWRKGDPLTTEEVCITYGIGCEHGELNRACLPLERNAEVENVVKDFLEEGMRQAHIYEGIENVSN